MKLNLAKTLIVAGVTSLAAMTFAQQAPAAPAAKAAPAASAMTFEKLLASLPDVVGEYQDSKLTKAELIDTMKKINMPVDQLAGIEKSALDGMLYELISNILMEKAVLLQAEKAGFKASKEEALKMMQSEFDKMPKEQQAMVLESLKQRGMTLEQYIDKAVNNPAALNQLALRKFLDTRVTEAEKKISAEDVKKFYDLNKAQMFTEPETVTAAHILLDVCPMDLQTRQPRDQKVIAQLDAEAKKKIPEIEARLKKGELFEKLAAEYSACPSKNDGGKLPPFTLNGQMDPVFSKAAFELKKDGDVSPVTKTTFGYHFIKRLSRSAAKVIPLDDKLSAQIKKGLASREVQQNFRMEMEQIEKAIKVFGVKKPAPPAPPAAPAAK